MAVEDWIVNSVNVIDLCAVTLIGASHIYREAINTNETFGSKMNCSAVAVRITNCVL